MRTEDFVRTITTFEYKAFDMNQNFTGFLYDATPQQCCDFVWKKICSSAVFKRMTVFDLETGDRTSIETYNINNNHEAGKKASLEDTTEHIEQFKEKYKLE